LFCKYVHLTSNCPYLVFVVSRSGGVPSVSSRGRERVQPAFVIATMQHICSPDFHLRSTPRPSDQTIFEKHPPPLTAVGSPRPSRSRSARAASTPAVNTGRCDATRFFAASKRSRFFMMGWYRAPASGSERGRLLARPVRRRCSRLGRALEPGLACAPRKRADPRGPRALAVLARLLQPAATSQHAPDRPATAYTSLKLRTM
jgi:hypothetical protein